MGRLAAERGDPLIREQEEKEDREVEEKPGWGGVTQPEGLQSRVSKGAQ